MDFMVFGLLTSVGPIGFYNHKKAQKKKLIEEQLPDFLREISSATSSGMTIFDAIITSAKGDHGKLTPELQMMASQLSWGISVNEALDNFAKRINTPSVKRIVVTINKALEIGGNTAAVFEAAAREIDQVKIVEEQRKSEMTMYAMVIFISFAVFLAVILIINNTIFAAIYDLDFSQADVQGSNFAGLNPPDREILKNTFFLFVVVQSMGGGLLGGFMTEGKLSSGVRYAFALILISFLVFKVMM
jgi:flagellar protein FlaJ